MTQSVHPEGADAPRNQSVSLPALARSGAKGGVARLSPAQIATLSKAREARWQPGMDNQPLHSEIFAGTGDACGAGFAFALARDALTVAARRKDPLAQVDDRRQVLWVQDARAIERGGRPYLHGLPEEWRTRLIHVAAKTPQDALFALEEGLRCREIACIIGEICGNPRALDFTASRRLSLAAEKHGVPLWLVRLEAEADLSSARMRWRVEASPSAIPRWDHRAPGKPAWKAELFRARSHAPGQWIMSNGDGAYGAGTLNASKPARRRSRAATPDPRDLVRASFGRSLAAVARI